MVVMEKMDKIVITTAVISALAASVGFQMVTSL